MHAIKLTKHVANPTTNAKLTPNLYLIYNVKNTFAISPTSGNINVKPANLPIQLDDKLACIIYNTSAVVPSITLPKTRNPK